MNETAKHFLMCLIWQKKKGSKLFHEQSTSDQSSKAQSPWDTHTETLADPVWQMLPDNQTGFTQLVTSQGNCSSQGEAADKGFLSGKVTQLWKATTSIGKPSTKVNMCHFLELITLD